MDRILNDEWGQALLLEYVFLEVVTALRARAGLATAVRVGESLLRAKEGDFVPCSEVFTSAFDCLRAETASLSFTDAAITEVARRNPHGFVATFDTDFAGLSGVTVVP
jgi:predicted nucleic acid-binding protein